MSMFWNEEVCGYVVIAVKAKYGGERERRKWVEEEKEKVFFEKNKRTKKLLPHNGGRVSYCCGWDQLFFLICLHFYNKPMYAYIQINEYKCLYFYQAKNTIV